MGDEWTREEMIGHFLWMEFNRVLSIQFFTCRVSDNDVCVYLCISHSLAPYRIDTSENRSRGWSRFHTE
jgi:hypothetical protein